MPKFYNQFLPNCLFLISVLLFFSCEKVEQVSLAGFEYPEGFTVVNRSKDNDCSLSKCSSKRVKRLKANKVVGWIGSDSTISVTMTFDSNMVLDLCQKIPTSFLDSFNWVSKAVIISGDIYDACGIASYDWPIEENYILHLKDIEPY
ncbi:hypothetical protein [Membranihabitans marinus]|uniref:hypothetical protein n=1 Tax=Membranihabitans marinus TaxID=1227546 RepID=UPI001F1D1473|nr:hypothetical protein [Membranihabitans marinus]